MKLDVIIGFLIVISVPNSSIAQEPSALTPRITGLTLPSGLSHVITDALEHGHLNIAPPPCDPNSGGNICSKIEVICNKENIVRGELIEEDRLNGILEKRIIGVKVYSSDSSGKWHVNKQYIDVERTRNGWDAFGLNDYSTNCRAARI